MNILVAGSRAITDKELVRKAIHDSGFEVTGIIHGGAYGVDCLAGEIAREDFGLEPMVYLPDWDLYGRRAGFVRNSLMVDRCDAVVVVWDGISRGTKDTIDKAVTAQKLCYVCYGSGLELELESGYERYQVQSME